MSTKVYKGTGSTQIAHIKNDKVYKGTGSTQIARIKNGKVYEGTGNTQIAHIKGSITTAELAAVLYIVLGLF